MKEDCFRMSLEHCAKFFPLKLAFVLPLNADQTFVIFPLNHFCFHNAADSIHVPLNDVFMYSSIKKSIVRKHNQC